MGIENFTYPPGATPLDQDEMDGLLPEHITTQSQLNEWEHANIQQAENWIQRKHFKLKDITSLEFVKKIHKRMFDRTWKWAGFFRQTEKSVGNTPWFYISQKLIELLDDVNYQINNKSYPLDELAARFHHRLVLIHPFPNGNGRHARLMTDILLLSQNHKRFLWGNSPLLSDYTPVRTAYINSLKLADLGNYTNLINFVRGK